MVAGVALVALVALAALAALAALVALVALAAEIALTVVCCAHLTALDAISVPKDSGAGSR